MERTTEARRDQDPAWRPGESHVALKAVSHHTLGLGVLYATTIIVVLMIVSRL